MDLGELTVVILCGGKGTRAHPHTAEVPKPLLDVAGTPILRHVMDIFAVQGCRRFVLAAGFRADLISAFAAGAPAGWEIVVSDQGDDAGTAERVWACREQVSDPFLVTYGDGVADVRLRDLTAFHAGHPGHATITTVALRSQYGTVESDPSGMVVCFEEKPVLDGHWINGGFFVLDRSVFSRWEGRDLEREVLPALVEAGWVYSYRHRGFWRSLDTYKDALELTELAGAERLPWLPG